MAGTAWPHVVDALVTQLRATTGFRSPLGTTGDIPVFDGTEVWTKSEEIVSFAVIGWPGDPNSPVDPGSFTQTPGPMSTNRPRDESGTVECFAVCQLGDADVGAGSVKAARDGAFAVVDAVQALCRGVSPGPTLGTQILWAFVTTGRPSQLMNQGAYCALPFTVTYQARI